MTFIVAIQLNDSIIVTADNKKIALKETGEIQFNNKKSQKIVLLEIMALIYSDNFLHEEERKVLEKILEEFNLNYHLATVYGEWAKAILSLYIQGNALVEL